MTEKQTAFLEGVIRELESQITAKADPEKDVLAFTRQDALVARDYIKGIIHEDDTKEASHLISLRGNPMLWRGMKDVVYYITNKDNNQTEKSARTISW